eukprot:88171_1
MNIFHRGRPSLSMPRFHCSLAGPFRTLVLFGLLIISCHSQHHHDDDSDEHEEHATETLWRAWLFGLVSVFLVSLVSLAGIALVAFGFDFEEYLLELIGLSVGTLIGSTFFKLIPETYHKLGFDLTVSVVMLAGVFFSFITEILMSLKRTPHTAGHHHVHTLETKRLDSPRLPKSKPDEEHVDLVLHDLAARSTASIQPHSPRQCSQGDCKRQAEVDEVMSKNFSVGAPKAPHREISLRDVPAFVLVNLVGDALHNFVDGALIGATFLVSYVDGIVIALSVAAHELPQEMGDFGILLHAGIGRKKALGLNLLVSLTAVLGGIIALLVGEEFEEQIAYLLPFASGIFLYLALADLTPELLKAEGRKRKIRVFCCVAVGMGILALLLLIPVDH